MLAIITFAASGILIVGFLWFKKWEHDREERVLGPLRDRLDHRTVVAAQRVCEDMPRAAREATVRACRGALHSAAQAGVTAARVAEKKLSKVADAIRGRHPVVKSERPTSDFLNNIVEHKQVLRNGNGMTAGEEETR